MLKQNVVLDFTHNSVIDEQELAIMPASLAKKLLFDYSKKLVKVSGRDIVSNLMDNIREDINKPDTVGLTMSKCLKFLNERSLIENCAAENWQVYDLREEVEEISEEDKAFFRGEKYGMQA
jgi:hypothetical protein